MIRFVIRIGDWSSFGVGALGAALLELPRPKDWIRPLYRTLIGGLPLAVVTGVALGAVIWMHTRGVLAKSGSGAVEFLPTFLAAAVLLELAPLGAGLIVAARTGASLGAELASMRVGEQIEALQLLGISPVRRLVGPRVLACLVAVPILHVLIAVLALGSGYIAESLIGQTTWRKYEQAVLLELHFTEVIAAGLKTPVFGALIGMTGCYVGLRASVDSEGVGRAATDSVVVCSLLVIAADVVLVALIQSVV